MTLDLQTLGIAIAAIAVVGTVCSALATQLAPNFPKAAAVCRVIAAVLIDLRAALLAGQAPPQAGATGGAPVAARKVPPGLGVLLVLALAGCTAAELQGVGAAVAAFGGLAPGSCTIVTAADGSQAGKVCGSVAGDVSGFATWLQGVLSTLPTSAAAKLAATSAPVAWETGGLHIELRADLAGPAQAAARAKAGIATAPAPSPAPAPAPAVIPFHSYLHIHDAGAQ